MDTLLDLLRRFEGLGDGDKAAPGLQPYLDPAGIWTIGWGSTYDRAGRRVTASTPAIGLAEADALLERDAAAAAAAVRRLVSAPLDTRSLSALADFVYNMGAGAFQASTLRRKLLAGDRAGAAAEFPRWVFAGGKRLPGLVRRRAAEQALFLG